MQIDVSGGLLTAAVAVLLGAVAGCGGEDEAAPVDVLDTFSGGQFQLQVHSVQDGCLDGALEVLFMPDGTGQPYSLINTTFIPEPADLPMDYQMQLEAPFDDMQITMVAAPDSAGHHMQVRDALQPEVLLQIPGSDDCTATITFDVDVTATGQRALDMRAVATLSNLQSATQTCPVLTADPCQAVLSMRGTR